MATAAKAAEVKADRPAKLADLKKGTRTRTPGLCTSCGKDKTVASVLLQVRKGKEHITSSSRSLCEECTIEVFDDLKDSLDEHTKRS